jgi:hypothetical protein
MTPSIKHNLSPKQIKLVTKVLADNFCHATLLYSEEFGSFQWLQGSVICSQNNYFSQASGISHHSSSHFAHKSFKLLLSYLKRCSFNVNMRSTWLTESENLGFHSGSATSQLYDIGQINLYSSFCNLRKQGHSHGDTVKTYVKF